MPAAGPLVSAATISLALSSDQVYSEARNFRRSVYLKLIEGCLGFRMLLAFMAQFQVKWDS